MVASGSGVREPEGIERDLRATLWEWRDALADGAGKADVDALVEAMLETWRLSLRKKTKTARLLITFAPGARVLAAGDVASATLLVTAGSVEERDGVLTRGSVRERPIDGLGAFGRDTRAFGPGRFAGERAYFERCAPGAEDAFETEVDVFDDAAARGGVEDEKNKKARAASHDATRRRDAFAHETRGCSVIVFEHDALDRLAARAPGFALAMFARMAANAVQALP